MTSPNNTRDAAAPSTLNLMSNSGSRFSWASRLLGVQGPLIGLLLLCVVFSFSTSGAFLSVRNGLNVLDQVTVLGILSIGMTAVIVTGGIDLSVGSNLALSMMVMGWLSHNLNVPLALSMFAAVLVGGVCGLANGLLVTKARLPAFIATLSVMTIARGLANIITDGQQIVGYPDWFDNLATVRYFGFFSFTVVIAIAQHVNSTASNRLGIVSIDLIRLQGGSSRKWGSF